MNDTRKEILLESGTNEIEILEFLIHDNILGINVAKVKNIMMPEKVKSIPHSHEAVEGVFKPRETVITVIDLPKYLGLPSSPQGANDLFIVTHFNKIQIAFRVHSVVDIMRISWQAIQKPDKTIYGGVDGVATGLAEYNGKLVTILDFEKIVADICPETSIQMSEIDNLGVRVKDATPIIIAEDSILLSKLIVECLHKAGFSNIKKFDNGEEAWNYLESIKDSSNDNLLDIVSCIITDIEMPKMDGHRLTKLVKEDKNLKIIPLVIFSSLINDAMYRKGQELGADEQLSKPEIGHLVEVIDQLIRRSTSKKK